MALSKSICVKCLLHLIRLNHYNGMKITKTRELLCALNRWHNLQILSLIFAWAKSSKLTSKQIDLSRTIHLCMPWDWTKQLHLRVSVCRMQSSKRSICVILKYSLRNGCNWHKRFTKHAWIGDYSFASTFLWIAIIECYKI